VVFCLIQYVVTVHAHSKNDHQGGAQNPLQVDDSSFTLSYFTITARPSGITATLAVLPRSW